MSKVEIFKATARNKAFLNKALSEQGVSEDSPIRGVLDNYRGDFKAVSYDGAGSITGMIDFKIHRAMTQIEIYDMRCLIKGSGYGKALISKVAGSVAGLPREPMYEMRVYGALSTAVGFYERTGAVFVPWSSIGTWDASTVAHMARVGI